MLIKDQKKDLRTINLLWGIWSCLSIKRKKQLIFCIFLSIIGAISEIFSIAIIFPFLALALEPNKLSDYWIIGNLKNSLNLENNNSIYLYLAIILILAVILSSSLRLYNLRYSIKLAQTIGSELTSRALNRFICQDYETHINRNSSEVIATINSNIDGAIQGIDSALILAANLIISISILISLAGLNHLITTTLILFFFISYLILSSYSKKIYIKNSRKLVNLNPRKEKVLYESLTGIREVILSNLQKYYLNKFKFVDLKIRESIAQNHYVSSSFRYYLEGICVILIVTIFLIFQIKGLSTSIPLLGTFAFATQKLLPSLQTIFRMWSNVRARKYQIIKTLQIIGPNKDSSSKDYSKSLIFKKNIRLKNISYKYQNTNDFIFENINLIIQKGEIIGIKGNTGCGKTTLINIIISLIKPTKGNLFIDDINLYAEDENLIEKWRSMVADVPQNIFLADASFSENIAFGIDKAKINFTKVKEAAEKAQIASYIETSKNKYDTNIGEKGLKLSGGQRQRIAIARALYKNSQLLVLDEATSSLDENTQENIMKTIKSLSGDLTVIIIAHRLSTLKDCDRILEIKEGNIYEKQTY